MNRTRTRFFIFTFLFLIFFCSSLSFADESNNYVLEFCNLSSGGYPEESANFCFSQIVLGEEISGEGQCPNYILSAGYIYINIVGDSPPVLGEIGDKTVPEGETLSFTIQAYDPNGDTLVYSASNLPTGADFEPLTGAFSWTPTYDQAGVYPNVHFEVTDGALIDLEDITITVTNVNRPPILTYIGNKSVGEGHLLRFTIGATDPDTGTNLTYSASNLPPGAEFNTTTKTFNWVPGVGQSGIYTNVRFEVSDTIDIDSEDITITVSDATPPDQPALDPITSPTKDKNQIITGTKSQDAVNIIVTSSQAAIGAVTYPTSTTWSFEATLEEDDNEFTVVAEDATGNQSSPLYFTIVLDTTPPDFTIDFPPDGSYIDKYGNAR